MPAPRTTLPHRASHRALHRALHRPLHGARRAAPATVVVALLAVLLPLLPAGPASGATREPDQADPIGQWPLLPVPEVVRGFDPPDTPYGAGHRGVDLAGSVGERVRAALPGEVTYAGPLAGRGVVVVDHGATRTTYEPVAASVSVGQRVRGGQPIGTLQLPGSHCFPRACLHWGWIKGAQTYLDPLRLVGAGPVRLLPLWRDEPVAGGVIVPAARLPAVPYAGPVLGLLGLV